MFAEYEHLKALPKDEKIQLIEELESSLGDVEVNGLPMLHDAILRDIERRDAAMDADPNRGISEEEFYRRMDQDCA
jgi:putative addiction module component (TIGR02574 family)